MQEMTRNLSPEDQQTRVRELAADNARQQAEIRRLSELKRHLRAGLTDAETRRLAELKRQLRAGLTEEEAEEALRIGRVRFESAVARRRKDS